MRGVPWGAGALLVLAAGCAGPPSPAVPEPVPPPPSLLAEEISGLDEAPPPRVLPRERRPERPSPLAGEGGERITITAQDADVRALLTLLAEVAGVDLVLGAEVQGRVSIVFEDVPARVALLAVVREAGLEVREPLVAPWGPVVFYTVPVNVNRASAETIARRFHVSEEIASWLVEARIPPRR